ncbi:hypothetical protein ANO11243_077190 [Dothideomycetidae sp. 11243]|nr:hypothetical protein ANO11243_077190 [fungal sp. No.11243]
MVRKENEAAGGEQQPFSLISSGPSAFPFFAGPDLLGQFVEQAKFMDAHGIKIRVGSRVSANSFELLCATSIRDSHRFERIVIDSVKANPEEPLVVTANGYEPFLEDTFASCIDFRQSSPAMTNREVHFTDNVQLPQSADRRAAQVPWTFIVDQLNLPEVWHWTFGRHSPREEHASSRAWVCDQGAYRFDARIPVVLLFTRSDHISEDIVNNLIFPHIFQAARIYDDPAADDAVCWVFYQLYNLLTDWQNIIGEVGRKLNQAELDSHVRDLPVKVRTRRLHKEVDRIYELHDFLQFHSRAFKKLAKFKTSEATVSKYGNTIWEVIDDCLEDLEQYENYLDSTKERFNNLIELDFNIENATQCERLTRYTMLVADIEAAANARFISILGALFLPVSFVAVNAAHSLLCDTITDVPLLLCLTIPAMISANEVKKHPTHLKRIQLRQQDFTMLGREAPEGAEIQHPDTSSASSVQFAPTDRAEREPPRKPAPPIKRVPSPAGHRSLQPPGRLPKMENKATFYRIPRSPGVVGTRKKNLHDDDTRREQMQFRDFQREVDRAAGGDGFTRPRHGRRSVSRGRQSWSRTYTDGCYDYYGRDYDVDVEMLGSRRRRPMSQSLD